MRRRALLGSALQLALSIAALPARAQPRRQTVAPPGPALSASRSVMAGSMLSVMVSRAPDGARLAVARPTDPPHSAIVVVELSGRSSASLPVPGEAGDFELRLTQDDGGAPAILLRQPLATTRAEATLAAPARVRRGQALPVRGIGPNGEGDRIVLAPAGAPADAEGPFFFPRENVEAMLEAPEQPGAYELRYVMDAPLSGPRILARQAVIVE